MRIRFQSKQSAGKNSTPARNRSPQAGHGCDEVMLTTAFLVVVVAFVYVLCSGGLCSIQSIWESLPATRVVMQKAEALSLVTGRQVPDSKNAHQPVIVGQSDRPGRASDSPDALHANMGTVTVRVYWTNCESAKPVVHSRQIQTRLAPNGAPKYIWRAL